jgi:hypothetical protein
MAGVNPFDGLPETLRIGAYDWRIYLKPEIKDETGDDIAGHCVERGFTFEFNTDPDIHSNPLIAMETVLHEITHAIFSTGHITKGDTEERVCLILGSLWTQIYRDNPKLMQWIVDVLAEVK